MTTHPNTAAAMAAPWKEDAPRARNVSAPPSEMESWRRRDHEGPTTMACPTATALRVYVDVVGDGKLMP